ncbi:4Fe-4S cluster-binding domain-containing protein, partial [Staphylococcus epidermidis]|uniref:4Fe-4S cluster-binding domain-containing protein n=1 Tax=Staphylococcus epidermidis TaxID=1282 RepID=UPI0037DA4640
MQTHTFVHGEGLPSTLYLSPSPFQSKPSYNLKPQNFKYPEPFQLQILQHILHYSPPSYIQRLSILPPQPFSNFFITLQLLQPFTQPFPHTKTISLSTPFLFQYFKHQDDPRNSLLQHIDLLVHRIFIQ